MRRNGAFITALSAGILRPVLTSQEATMPATTADLTGYTDAARRANPLANAAHMTRTVAHVTDVSHGGVTGRGYAYPITGAFDSENS